MRDHTKRPAFELADSLAKAVYRRTRDFPTSERFGRTHQLRRGAVSVASNIVEGCARRSERDYIRFVDMAYSAARELEYQIGLAHRLGYLDERTGAALSALAEETCKVLGGLVRSFRSDRSAS